MFGHFKIPLMTGEHLQARIGKQALAKLSKPIHNVKKHLTAYP